MSSGGEDDMFGSFNLNLQLDDTQQTQDLKLDDTQQSRNLKLDDTQQSQDLELDDTQQSQESFEPFTQANIIRNDLKLPEISTEESDMESSSDMEGNEGSGLGEEIAANEKLKKKLKQELEDLEKEDRESEEAIWTRLLRMQEKKNFVQKQQAELFRQQEILGKRVEIEEVTTESLNRKIKGIENILDTMSDNVMRVSKGKNAVKEKINFRTETVKLLSESKKEIFIFYTGKDIMECQPKQIREEIQQAKEVKIVQTSEMKKVAMEIRECGVREKEGVGVCFVNWKEMAEAEDEDILKREGMKLMSSLRLVTSRGGESFGRFFLVIPPQVGKHREELEAIAEKIESTYNPDVEMVNLTKLMKDGWRKEPGGGGEKEIDEECVFFCRSISEIAKVVSDKMEELAGECEGCGLLHVGQCLLEEEL